MHFVQNYIFNLFLPFPASNMVYFQRIWHEHGGTKTASRTAAAMFVWRNVNKQAHVRWKVPDVNNNITYMYLVNLINIDFKLISKRFLTVFKVEMDSLVTF